MTSRRDAAGTRNGGLPARGDTQEPRPRRTVPSPALAAILAQGAAAAQEWRTERNVETAAAVSAASPIGTGRDLLERLGNDPLSLSFASASSAGDHDHVISGAVFGEAGADPRKEKVVIQKSGGEAMAAPLGGHIVAVGAPAPTSCPPRAGHGCRLLQLARSHPARRGSRPRRSPPGTAPSPARPRARTGSGIWRGMPGGATPMRSSEARRRLAAEHALLARMLDELGPVKR